MSTIYRVQDMDGRGPWKPGFSHQWMDKDIGDRNHILSWIEEFGLDVLKSARKDQIFGCGCTSLEQLSKWFTPTERRRLQQLGYEVVSMEPTAILASSEIQCVFVRDIPLSHDVVVIPWQSMINFH